MLSFSFLDFASVVPKIQHYGFRTIVTKDRPSGAIRVGFATILHSNGAQESVSTRSVMENGNF